MFDVPPRNERVIGVPEGGGGGGGPDEALVLAYAFA